MTYYNKIAKGYNKLYGEEQLKKVNIILSNIKLKKSDKLLDVGCGTGFYLDLFNCNITGVDPSEELLKQRNSTNLQIGGMSSAQKPHVNWCNSESSKNKRFFGTLGNARHFLCAENLKFSSMPEISDFPARQKPRNVIANENTPPVSDGRFLTQCKHKTIKASAENLPFKNNEFDWVISITAIHNFKNISKAVDEIKRVGKDKFVFSVLKKSKKFSEIDNLIRKKYNVKKIVIEEKDVILFCINTKI